MEVSLFIIILEYALALINGGGAAFVEGPSTLSAIISNAGLYFESKYTNFSGSLSFGIMGLLAIFLILML